VESDRQPQVEATPATHGSRGAPLARGLRTPFPDVAALQRAIGNRAVGRLLHPPDAMSQPVEATLLQRNVVGGYGSAPLSDAAPRERMLELQRAVTDREVARLHSTRAGPGEVPTPARMPAGRKLARGVSWRGALPSPPSYARALRISVIGFSSARWRAARTASEADAHNLKLSWERAEAVKKILLEEVALRSGAFSIPVTVDIIMVDDEHTSVALQVAGEGSHAAVERHSGTRTSDDSMDRLVRIRADLVTTESGQKRGPRQESGIQRDWMLTVTGFREIAAGVAYAELDVEITKAWSPRPAKGSAQLWGGGLGVGVSVRKDAQGKVKGSAVPTGLIKRPIGKHNIRFTTDTPVGFAAFDMAPVRMGRVKGQVVLGPKYLYLVFPELSSDKIAITPLAMGMGWGASGYVVSGTLKLEHPLPPDTIERPQVGLNDYKAKSASSKEDSIGFSTGSANVSFDQDTRVRDLIKEWAASLR
jgi:hypothetical protein